jgi:hypothetical protein
LGTGDWGLGRFINNKELAKETVNNLNKAELCSISWINLSLPNW